MVAINWTAELLVWSLLLYGVLDVFDSGLHFSSMYVESSVSKKYYGLIFIPTLVGLTQIQGLALYTEIPFQ